jgi:hypothetical protein
VRAAVPAVRITKLAHATATKELRPMVRDRRFCVMVVMLLTSSPGIPA